MYFNASLGRLLTNLPKLELMNWKLSINVRWFPSMNAIYFFMLFGIALILAELYHDYTT